MKTGRSAPQAPCRPVVRRLLRPPVPGRLSAGAGRRPCGEGTGDRPPGYAPSPSASRIIPRFERPSTQTQSGRSNRTCRRNVPS